MGAGRICIGCILRSHSKSASLLDDVHELFRGVDGYLVNSDHINVALLVLPNLKLISVIEQVVQLAAVDFEEGYVD